MENDYDYDFNPNPPSRLMEAIKAWLWFDLFMALALWMAIGPEGLAEMACHVIEDPVCEQFE